MSTRREKLKRQRLSQAAIAQVNEKEKCRNEKNEFIVEVGKFFVDLAKLTFAGVFLTAVMDISLDMVEVMKWGLAVILAFAVLGFVVLKLGYGKK